MLAFAYLLYAGASVIKAQPESAGAVLFDSLLTPAPPIFVRGVLFNHKRKGVCYD